MPETFTFDRADRLADILYGVAAVGGLIEYDVLGHRVGMRADFLAHSLGQVSRRAVAASGPMWTALAVSAHAQRPSEGFYRLARELRNEEYSGLSDEELWQRERQYCYDAVAHRHTTVAVG
jgi:hypothetical protein